MSPIRAIPTKMKKKKSLDDLPEEIILKIADNLSSDFDFVAFSHANLRTFQIISKSSLIWKQRLDPEDQNYCVKMKSEFRNKISSCPEKEMFFRRSNSERNLRKGKFRILYNQCLYDEDFEYMLCTESESYRDFYVHHWYIEDQINFIWIDLSRKKDLIRTGVLSRKMPDRKLFYCGSNVFAASKSILIVQQTERYVMSPPYQHSLFAIDITSPDNLRVLWEHNSVSNVKCEVCVANFKIYKSESSPDNSVVISILSAETGQTLSMWPLRKVSEHIFKPNCRIELTHVFTALWSNLLAYYKQVKLFHNTLNTSVNGMSQRV